MARKSVPAAQAALCLLGAFCLFCLSGLSGCGSSKPVDKPLPPLQPEWRLVPEATIVGDRRQFFLYGRRLDSATVAVPPSVILEKGTLKADGRVLSLYMTMRAAKKDSLAEGEKIGLREVRVKTPDTALTFQIKVVDEALPH
jgi:hypothetical protein